MKRGKVRNRMVAVALVMTVCAACDTGPSDADVSAASDASRTRVQDTASHVVEVIETEASDLSLRLDYVPEVDDLWDTCDDQVPQPGQDPKLIQWVAHRTLVVDPPQETASRLDAVLARLVADGWTLRDDVVNGGGRRATVNKDGYTISLGADSETQQGAPSSIGAHVYGPCISAPAGVHS